MNDINSSKHLIGLAFLAALSYTATAYATNGHTLQGVGSISQSMGGASLATSLDAIGSNTSNVSSIAFLDRSSIEFGAELFVPDRSLGATAPTPTGVASGTVESKTREAVIPAFGLVYKTGGPWTFGFSAVGIGGFGVDYPANLPNASGRFNPLAVPQNFGGFGAIDSNYQLLQLTPSAAYKVTDDWSLGLGINADWASLAVDPWPATPPKAGAGYPSGSHAATAWGGGVTVGTTYKIQPNLTFGASVKSPQWFGKFQWNSQYPDGTPANFGFRLDYPLIAGVGLSYRPVDKLLLAADLKWINYSDTKGFREKNWANAGKGPYVRGFGWQDIWAVSLGAQYSLTERLKLRAGYNYGENPIPSDQQFFNVFAPAIVQHHASVGVGFNITDRLELNLAYYHAFQNEKSGAFINPTNNQAIPGTRVTNRLSENSGSAQVTYRF